MTDTTERKGPEAVPAQRRERLDSLKRVVVGRPRASSELHDTLLSKTLALPIFASDPLSSVAYAPDEIFLTLAIAGGAFATTHSWQIAVGVIVVASAGNEGDVPYVTGSPAIGKAPRGMFRNTHPAGSLHTNPRVWLR